MLIHAEESIWVDAPIDSVWDFTQDFARRNLWDDSVRSAVILSHDPLKVRVSGPGFQCTFEYKSSVRPTHTSLAVVDMKSLFFCGGGGSWRYESGRHGTTWTQRNSLKLRTIWTWLAPLFRWSLRKSTNRSLRKAKQLIEAA